MKKIVTLDVDGALVDSVGENYLRTKDAWREIYNEDYPIDYDTFRNVIRKKILVIEDFFNITYMLVDGKEIPKDHKEIENYFPEDAKHCKDIFYRLRAERIKADRDGWIKEQELYDGVPEMFDSLGKKDLSMLVVTSKNEDAVTEILGFYGLLKHIEKIYDREIGKRPEQFTMVRKDFGGDSKILHYDDMGKVLKIAKKMGIIPIGVPQGYDTKEILEGFRCALPAELPEVVDELMF